MIVDLSPEVRRMLLDLALGERKLRREHRFRNVETGDTVTQLDLRIHDFADWVSEERTVIETAWEPRT